MTAPPRGDRVSASVFVDAPPEIAFEVFTDQIDQWWFDCLRAGTVIRELPGWK